MSTYIHYEILLFLQSACMGALLFLGYAALSAIRAVFPHKGAVVAAEDLLYWLTAGMIVFARIYKTNQGILRSFWFLGLVLGGVICQKTAGPLFVKLLTILLFFPAELVKKLIKRLLFLGRSGKLYVYNSVKSRNQCGKKKISRTGRGGQVEKSRTKRNKKRTRYNYLGMLGIGMIVLVLLAGLMLESRTLESRLLVYTTRAAALEQSIEDQKERTKEIDELKKYMQTDEYAEEVARSKLGLVKENEIVFREEK